MVGKTPKWESELWSYVCSGDGMHCPFYSHCHIRLDGKWCPDDNREHIERLLDDEQCNLSDCDFIECGTCGGIFKMVEMVSQKYLEKGRIHCPPVPTELISRFDIGHAVEIRTIPLKSYHGAIWRLREGWIIQLNKNDTSARKRFTLFHETFHILAHCSNTTPVFRKTIGTRGSFNELLADGFATYLLMPEEWVMEKWAEVQDCGRMVEIFDVPQPAMCIRLKRLGLI